MARNYVGEGEVLDYTAGADAVVSGALVVIGKRVGIALADIPAHATGSLGVTGVWIVGKASATVVAQGAPLYWDADSGLLTTVAGDDLLAGFAAAPAAAGTAAVRIKINS